MKQKDRKQEMLDAYTLELIRQVESEGLRKAPAHMKAEILERSRKPDYQIALQTRRLSRNMQFFFYSLKVGAAVATALFLLFTVPREIPQNDGFFDREPGQAREASIGEKFNEGLRDFNQMLTEITISNQNRQGED
ncbi:MAG: hypothetical protein HFH25_06820 [Lachnospiraceae bacterium]|nr:hypothetical protein [Lachnospiraceae bacterium]